MREDIENVISPTLCGCIVQRVITWGVTHDVADKVANDMMRDMGMTRDSFADDNSYNNYRTNIRNKYLEASQSSHVQVGYGKVISQCKEHQGLTPEELYNTLTSITGIKYTPDTCGCNLYYYYSKSDPDNITYIYHPLHSKKCTLHEHLSNDDHAEVVVQENKKKNLVVNELASILKVDSQSVKYSFGSAREIILDSSGFRKLTQAELDKINSVNSETKII